MTKTHKYIVAFLGTCLLWGCSKDPEPSPLQQALTSLTGSGIKVWHLSQYYVNGTLQQLTGPQSNYTKTYRLNTSFEGGFEDSDGYTGTWTLASITTLSETINNNPSGNVQIDYSINAISTATLDVQYTSGGQVTRLVYHSG